MACGCSKNKAKIVKRPVAKQAVQSNKSPRTGVRRRIIKNGIHNL